MQNLSTDFFKPAVDYLIYNEIGSDPKGTGGFTNAAHDKGRATKFGISQRTLGVWRGFECTADDVRELTRPEAEDIYRVMYWQANSCQLLEHPEIATAILDLGCLFGVGVAARHAQVACQSIGDHSIKADGVIGPKSVIALNAVDPVRWITPYQSLFMIRITDICKRDPTQLKWCQGWENRVEKLSEIFKPQAIV